MQSCNRRYNERGDGELIALCQYTIIYYYCIVLYHLRAYVTVQVGLLCWWYCGNCWLVHYWHGGLLMQSRAVVDRCTLLAMASLPTASGNTQLLHTANGSFKASPIIVLYTVLCSMHKYVLHMNCIRHNIHWMTSLFWLEFHASLSISA